MPGSELKQARREAAKARRIQYLDGVQSQLASALKTLDAELTEVEAQRDELLDALIAFRDGGAGKNFDGWHESYRPAIDKAIAAIAKATGGAA